MQANQPTQATERESIWSVPRSLRRWYAGLFTFQFLIFLGLTIWDEVHYQTEDNALQTVLAVPRGMTQIILTIVATTYITLEAVMLAQWLRERDERKAQEAYAVIEQWQAWNARREAALAEGREFNEPTPSGPRGKNGK